MSSRWRPVLADLAVCGSLIAIAAATWWDASRLPPGRYDPLGGGTMPMIVSAGIVILSLAAIAQGLLKALLGAGRAAPAFAGERPRLLLAGAMFLNLSVFTALIAARVPFWLSSMLFVLVAVLLISGFRRSAILPGGVLAVTAGLTLTFLFTRVFSVDLP